MKMEKRSNLRHILAAILFCLVLSISIDCYAEGKGTVLFDSKIRQSPGTDSEPVGSAKKERALILLARQLERMEKSGMKSMLRQIKKAT